MNMLFTCINIAVDIAIIVAIVKIVKYIKKRKSIKQETMQKNL